MPLPVSLQAVIDEMDMQSEMVDGYINRKTGELISITEEEEWELRKIEDKKYDQKIEDLPGWMQDIMPKVKEVLHSENFISLPSPYEIHEYAIMKDFCYTVEDAEVKEELLVGIDGRGAFRMFKELIFRHDFRDDWFAYKNGSFKTIAADFLDAHDIPYVDDGP